MKQKTFSACSIMLILGSCSQTDDEGSFNSPPSYSLNLIDLDSKSLEDVKSLVVRDFVIPALQNREVRERLYEEGIHEYGPYHYDHLLSDKNLTRSSHILQILQPWLTPSNEAVLKKLLSYIPDFELAVPSNCDVWDYNSICHNCWVGWDDEIETNSHLWLYNSTDSLRAHVEEIFEGRQILIMLRKGETDRFVLEQFAAQDSSKSRIDGGQEWVAEIGSDDWAAIRKGRFKRYANLELKVYRGVNGSIIHTGYKRIDRSCAKNGFCSGAQYRIDLPAWNVQNIGNFFTMSWVAQKGGNSITISQTISTSTGSVTVTRPAGSRDVNAGLSMVQFSDFIGQVYNTGLLKWKMGHGTGCEYQGWFDGANCYLGTAPQGTTPFIYQGSFYHTPLAGNTCPIPGSFFDGANCFVTSIHPNVQPFIYLNSHFYVTKH